MPRMQRDFRFRVTKEVIINERAVNRPNHRGYRAEKMIQKGVSDIGPRFRFCYYIHTPQGKRVFGQYAPEYRERDFIKLLKQAISKKMFSKKSLKEIRLVVQNLSL